MQLAKCMMKLNSHVDPVRMQMTITQKINISEMNIQKIPNSHVCSSDESESKGIIADKNLLQVCYTHRSE